MKKLLIAMCVVLSCAVVLAQEKNSAVVQQPQANVPAEQPPWPVWAAFNSTKDIDVIGVRFTLPYGACESVTGFDLGLFGRCLYFEGLQLNLVRNEAKDILSGIQVGVYNTAGRADLLGIQVGLWNEAASFKGCQLGLVNITENGSGVQIGIINRAEAFYGFQGGLVNIIRENDFAFLPIINVGWELWTDPKF